MLHSPLANCLLRPRSSHHRHRRSSSSPSLTFPSNSTPWEEDALVHDPANHTHNSGSSSSSSSAASDDHRCRVSASAAVAPTNDSNNDTMHIMISPLPELHRPSFESPFPSPYSLNVPLEAGASYRCMATLASHASALCLQGSHVYSGLQSGDVAVLRQPKLPECGRFGIGSGAIKALDAATDGRIFTAHQDHKIRVWRRPDAPGFKYRLIRTLPTASDYLRNVLLASPRAYVQIRRHHRRLWIQHVDTISAVAASPDASVLYSASWDRTLKVWSLRSMRCLQSVKAHDDAVNALAAGPGDEYVYTASADGTVKAWRRLTHRHRLSLTATLDAGQASVNTLLATRPPAQHDDGHVILYSGGSDCCIRVWESDTWRCNDTRLAATLRGHRQPVLSLALSGPLLCSGSADKMIRVWRRSPSSGSYTCLAILKGHHGPVKSVAIAVGSLRSCFVYSASLDCTTKVWSVVFDKEDQYHDVHHDNSNTAHGENELRSCRKEYGALYNRVDARSYHPAT